MVEYTLAMHFTRGNQVLLFIPIDWSELQTP